jgi:acetyl esterase/lipase
MAMESTLAHVVLERASQAFVEATANPPFLYVLSPDEARKVLDHVQAALIDKLPVDERWITVRAGSDDQLSDLPPALLIVDEADVLRDEGEAYAARLRAAGVAVTTVRYDGTTHDFMMLNPLSNSRATRAAVAQSIAVLREALHR